MSHTRGMEVRDVELRRRDARRARCCVGTGGRRSRSACSPVWPVARHSACGGSPVVPPRSTTGSVAYEGAATLTIFGCQEGVTQADIEASGLPDLLRLRLRRPPRVPRRPSPRWNRRDDGHSPSAVWPPPTIPMGAGASSSPLPSTRRPCRSSARRSSSTGGSPTPTWLRRRRSTKRRPRASVSVSATSVIITPYRSDEFDLAGEGSAAAGGVPTTMTVVGITRRPNDLVGRLGWDEHLRGHQCGHRRPRMVEGDRRRCGGLRDRSLRADDFARRRCRRGADGEGALARPPLGGGFRRDLRPGQPTDRARCDPAPNGRALPDCRRHRARRVPVRWAGGLEAIASRVDRCGGARCDGDDPW